MKIETVDETNLDTAGYIHSESWKASHRSFCSPEFVEKHTPQAQTEYLRLELAAGKRLYILTDGIPAGIVSVSGNLIENLYVLPEMQNRGYGTTLLNFAAAQCDTPTLWVLNINENARRLYLRRGFTETGRRKLLNDNLYEIEMRRIDMEAQELFELAMKHIYGDGVPEDNELAVKLLTRARALGHRKAAYNLGICYHYGYGTGVDLAKAYELYLESANGGYGKGMELVGRFFNRGIHVQKDRARAEIWLRRAMASGDPNAEAEAEKELLVD